MNKSQIAAALREAVFTPGKRGPLKVIADVGDTEYYIRRAVEFATLSLTALSDDQRHKYLNNALSLIALAKVEIGPLDKPEPMVTVTSIPQPGDPVELRKKPLDVTCREAIDNGAPKFKVNHIPPSPELFGSEETDGETE